MKKYLYPLLVVFFGGMIALIIFKNKEKDEFRVFPLKERSAAVSGSGEWVNAKAAIEGLLAALRKNPDDRKAQLQLAEAYIQEARITGDHVYYDEAAMELLNDLLQKEPDNFEALSCKAAVYLSQHHFTDGKEIAMQALKLNPHNAYIYGLLVDANVELGDYKEAVKMSDKMVSIRPDLKSYSRISYLREIHGDYKGAIVAMKMAVASGIPGQEQTEWARIFLGHLYENTGAIDTAELCYRIALENRAGYAYAYAGLGRIEKANHNYKDAIKDFEKAEKLTSDYSFGDELTDLYRLDNQPEKAYKNAQAVIEKLNADSNSDERNSKTGHYSDRELAYAYLKVYKYDMALKHALIEYNRRPDNIDVNETLAWVYYKLGKYIDADKYINVAMKTNSQNPNLLYRACLIKMKSGFRKDGIALMEKALDINPFLSPELKSEGIQFLASK
jgi:tetratricopeptide (TPR) repeat protein